MSYETPMVSAEVINSAFFDKLDNGFIKEAQEAGTNYIRQKLHEEGVLRRLFSPKTITADELDPNVTDDKPSIIVEKEPDASKATFVPFKGTGERKYFEGKRFRVPFGKVEAERMSKSKFELMTIRMDIMSWLKENQVKMIQQQEDQYFMDTCKAIVTANAAKQVVDASGLNNFKQAFVAGLKAMTSLRLPVGKVLMHKNAYYASLALKTEDIGHKPQEDRFANGVDNEASFLGQTVVTTIKDDIVAANEMWFFAPQDFFCKFYLLQDATLFLEYRADMVHFFTYEAPGFGIGNTLGVVKVTF